MTALGVGRGVALVPLGWAADRFSKRAILLGSLALVGDLAADDERANQVGKYNSWWMAAGITGPLAAGALFDLYGFRPLFAGLVVLFALALVGVWLLVEDDGDRSTRCPWRPRDGSVT